MPYGKSQPNNCYSSRQKASTGRFLLCEPPYLHQFFSVLLSDKQGDFFMFCMWGDLTPTGFGGRATGNEKLCQSTKLRERLKLRFCQASCNGCFGCLTASHSLTTAIALGKKRPQDVFCSVSPLTSTSFLVPCLVIGRAIFLLLINRACRQYVFVKPVYAKRLLVD